jgi:zinc D-Ala-D-Ala carboxypeptidase
MKSSKALGQARFIVIAMITALSVISFGSGLKRSMSASEPVPVTEGGPRPPIPMPTGVSIASAQQKTSAVQPGMGLASPALPDTSGLSKEPIVIKNVPIPTGQTATPQQLSQVAVAPITQQVKTLYGHLPYEENEPGRLVNAGQFIRGDYVRSEQLDEETDAAFRQMAADAKAQGISLMPISGFRNVADQKDLFTKQIARRGSEEAASKLSAPPGHSEHHTGYALDIADAQQPDTDLKFSFQDTAAYQWLVGNAPKYGFELSFPENNKQGVSFEPWHWRYVGSPRASQIFATARSLRAN